MALKVISGKLLIPMRKEREIITELGRYSEDDYRDLLQKSQLYFHKIKENPMLIEDNSYYIRAPKLFCMDKQISHVDFIDNEREAINAHTVWVNKAIQVINEGDQYRFCGCDGRKRFITACLTELDILVDEY